MARRIAIGVSRHPEWVGCASLVVALLFLLLRLGFADGGAQARWISSDTLWPVDVFVDIFKDHYAISGWRFSIAPFWFPDLVVTGAFWGLIRNPILATLLAGFSQMFAIVAAFHLLGRVIGPGKLFLQDTILLACGAGLTLVVAERPGLNYPNVQLLFLPEGHVGNMLLVLFGWGMALWILQERRQRTPLRAWLVTTYAIVCLLAGMSNLFFFPHMLVPLTFALAMSMFFGLMTIRQCWVPVAVGWLAAILGAILNRILFSTADVGVQSTVAFEPVLTALDVFMRGFVSRLLARDPLHIAAVLWVFVCLGYLAWFIRRLIIRGVPRMAEPDLLRAIFFTMSLTASVLSVASIVLGGSNGLAVFKDYVWSMHYLHQTFFVPAFGLAMCAAWGLTAFLNNRTALALAWSLSLPLLLIASALFMREPKPKTAIYAYQPPLVRYLDQIAPARKLHYGYAGYWQARLITLLSKTGIRAYAVDGSMNPYIWACNSQWYRQSLENRAIPPHIDFVVLDDPLWKLTREAAIRVFGEPVSETQVESTRILIYSGGK